MAELTTTASCLACEWAETGTWEAAAKAGEKHTRQAGHPVETKTEWASYLGDCTRVPCSRCQHQAVSR